MKIFLVRQTSHYTHPLMGYGVGIIATILHDAGHEVKVVDNNSVYRRYSDDQLVSQIRDFNPDVLGHGITMPSAIHHYRLSARIREEFPDLPQIAGGLHLKGAYEEVLRHDIDIACVREGEKLILPLVEHIASAKQRGVPLTQGLEVIDGLAYLGSDGKIVHPQKFPILDDLDDVPIVNYDLFNFEDFKKHGNEPAIFPLVSQRGCPYKCTFCSDAFQRGDKRMATAQWMFDNVKDMHERYGAFYVAITDNNFALKKNRVVEFCNLMISSGLNKKMRFSIQTKIESPMDDETLALLKKAGLKLVGFGLERLDDYSQGMIQKKCSFDRIEKVLTSVKNADIEMSINMLIGFPFDSMETLREEKRLFDLMQQYTKQINCSILQPIPGTAYYDEYPRAIEWYLNPKYDQVYRAHFAVVKEGYMEALADLNFFEHDDSVVEEFKSVYGHFNDVAYGRYFPNKTLFVRLALGVDKFFGNLSRQIFRISPDLEFAIFRRLRAVRYYVATKLYGRRVLVLGRVNSDPDRITSDSQSDKDRITGTENNVLANSQPNMADSFASKAMH